MKKKRVMIGTLVRQKPQILKAYLDSIASLNTENLEVTCALVEDNIIEESTKMLEEFKREHDNVRIYKFQTDDDNEFDYHKWSMTAILRIACFKNKLIKIAIDEGYDYIFLVDSDTVLQPITIDYLIKADKDVISEVHWTHISNTYAPNAWLYDNFDFAYRNSKDEKISRVKQYQRMFEFHNKLKSPGLYPVGGICDIIMLSREAMIKGVNFEDIYNVSFVGESAHLCIRAAVLGFQIYIDTHYPAYHIFTEDLLAGVDEFVKNSVYK